MAKDVGEARALYDIVKTQGRDGADGIVQVEKPLMHLEFDEAEEQDPYGEGSFPKPKPIPGDDGAGRVRQVAYYKGCLASLSAEGARHLDDALAPEVGLELIELESVTCCGAGDIHEAEPDYYLHLNARILAYAEETGADTLMTVCNVCTLNLRQANHALKHDELLERVNTNLLSVGAPAYSGGVEVLHFLWLVAAGDGYEPAQDRRAQGAERAQDRAVLRLPDPPPVEAPRVRGPRTSRSRSSGSSRPAAGSRSTIRRRSSAAAFRSSRPARRWRLPSSIQPIEQAMQAGADAMVTPCPLSTSRSTRGN